MDYDELKVAVDHGHKASSVLRQVLVELVDNHYCREAEGFDGPETFPDCGKCMYCLAKRVLNESESA